jgi:hypothetical protein
MVVELLPNNVPGGTEEALAALNGADLVVALFWPNVNPVFEPVPVSVEVVAVVPI